MLQRLIVTYSVKYQEYISFKNDGGYRTQKQIDSLTNNIIKNGIENPIEVIRNENGQIHIEPVDLDNIKKIRSNIRNTKLNVSKLKRGITDYNNFRKSHFGKLRIGNDGLDVDIFYKELSMWIRLSIVFD